MKIEGANQTTLMIRMKTRAKKLGGIGGIALSLTSFYKHPMNLIRYKPKQALNKAFLKVKPGRTAIELFKANLNELLDRANDTESEEFHKNLLSDFLKETWYKPNHYINTKGRNDLVIQNGKDAGTTVGVIIEAKKPTNKAEMPGVSEGQSNNLNTKAFQELVLYYLRERFTHKNLEVKHLIITNLYEWYVFDATLFERLFAQNKSLVQQFTEFEAGRLADSRTDFFYTRIAAPFIDTLAVEIEYTYFDLHDYLKPLRNTSPSDDKVLIELFKLLSPEHLLKLPFANDSNTLDKGFYIELLHIMGLTETREGGRKLIGRNAEGSRNGGSILEDAMIQLDSLDKIGRIEKPGLYGATMQERLFNVALELCITWINRILFLKLLEGQLRTYHKGDPAYAFLNSNLIKDYDDLNTLFFQVLARLPHERNETVKERFVQVPYLNSSLFEPTELEHTALFISNLSGNTPVPLHPQTVLKDKRGRRFSGTMTALEYLLAFLDAYDFSSEGSTEIQEENKTLINASVLGLIFEKINGYRDGSFFTPGFITMYMCRETIRRAVVQKFNEVKGWRCQTLDDLYDKIEDRSEANTIINGVRICDPAVGSGHFLVSALNELIAVKNDLRILQDRNGRRLKEYHIMVENDELVVTDEDGGLFTYHPGSPESQRVQETLFHEKQTIIENCLFGVDINPNSVKICRLRLWIELLKNAYYRNATELETLPNIDINIKCGNSLVSRFALDADLRQALKKSRWSIDSYRVAVATYRNAHNKEEKREMERLIADIKTGFESEISVNDPRLKRLRKLNGELSFMTTQPQLFEMTRKEKADFDRRAADLAEEIRKIETQLEEIRSNRIYENAFEWRFEFPEVLDHDGTFTGFDLVIGNPPYIRQEAIAELKPYLKSNYSLYSGIADIYIFFIEKGFQIVKRNGSFTFIMPNKFMQAGYGQAARQFLASINVLEIIDFGDQQVFSEATTYPCVLSAINGEPSASFSVAKVDTLGFKKTFSQYISQIRQSVSHASLLEDVWILSGAGETQLLEAIRQRSIPLESYVDIPPKRGILTGLTEAFLIDNDTRDHIIRNDPNSAALIKPFLLGRDIKPYMKPMNTNWLILVPKGLTIRKNLPEDNPYHVSEPIPRYGYMEFDHAWEWFSENYPGIANHLLPFKHKAEQRTDQGDYWWELRACDYYDLFAQPKIMYQVLQVKPCFVFDDFGMYCNNSMWFIPTDDKVLLGILNSRLGWWLISRYCTAIQNGHQLIWKYFSQIPIATGNQPIRSRIEVLVNKVLQEKQDPSSDTTALEAEIDRLVYELYGLTEEEVKIIQKP
jgi:adenine-specific DNA-methyltransferase